VSATAPVPPEIDAAVTRCLQKAKEDRFPSVEALLEALQQGAREVAESVTVPGIAVEVRIALGGVDEERLMRAGDLLAAVEPLLSGAGLQPIVQTGTVLLYAMALEPAQAPRTREALQRVAQRIAALGAPEASAGLEVRVRTEEGEVSMQGGELVGGALLNAERWERST
jgi:serine/threonine-protein kinase